VSRCDQNHQTCKGAIDTLWFPTRLSHIGEEKEEPRLCVPDVPSWSPDDRYITLSHRWGSNSSQVTKLVTENLDAFQHKIPTREIPQTFKDAINITRLLGVRYLWIDSLCIIQNDEKDWAGEAGRMSMLYTNTYLNISATSAENGHQGCYHDHDPTTAAGFLTKRPHSIKEAGFYRNTCYLQESSTSLPTKQSGNVAKITHARHFQQKCLARRSPVAEFVGPTLKPKCGRELSKRIPEQI
ncbi:heterokaryon incompatibility protein-domain-containing protein, partial [Clohesyomyces aquaticus]